MSLQTVHQNGIHWYGAILESGGITDWFIYSIRSLLDVQGIQVFKGFLWLSAFHCQVSGDAVFRLLFNFLSGSAI
jgi:hypothetical protein